MLCNALNFIVLPKWLQWIVLQCCAIQSIDRSRKQGYSMECCCMLVDWNGWAEVGITWWGAGRATDFKLSLSSSFPKGFQPLSQIHFAIWDKYIWQFETNKLMGLRAGNWLQAITVFVFSKRISTIGKLFSLAQPSSREYSTAWASLKIWSSCQPFQTGWTPLTLTKHRLCVNFIINETRFYERLDYNRKFLHPKFVRLQSGFSPDVEQESAWDLPFVHCQPSKLAQAWWFFVSPIFHSNSFHRLMANAGVEKMRPEIVFTM